MESRAQMSQSAQGKHHQPEAAYRSCSQSLPLDILWLPRSSFRPAEGELADCVLVVGVSRPKLAAALLSVTLLSLFLTFHVLYDSALYSIQAASMASAANENRKLLQNQEANSRTINHPMALRKRMRPPRQPRPTRRLPQALIIGVRKCGTRALLEMLYLHPMVQKASGEVHFFDRDENYSLGLEWYRSKMPLSFKGQITIEKSPSYFVTPELSTEEKSTLLNPVPEEHVRVTSSSQAVQPPPNDDEPGSSASLSTSGEKTRRGSSAQQPQQLRFDFDGDFLNFEFATLQFAYCNARFSSLTDVDRLCNVALQVPERVRAMNSSVRLLLIVREPVTRAISDYTQLRSRATPSAPAQPQLPGHPVPDAAKPFEHLAISPDGSINVAYRPIAISLYHAYLHRWLEVFPREQILVVNGDLLIEDPVPQLRRIEKFLGLEHKIGRKNFYFNETKGFYCLRNDTTDKCLRETKGRKHPRVDPAVVTKLRKFFIQHNQRFYDLVGEDLGWPED